MLHDMASTSSKMLTLNVKITHCIPRNIMYLFMGACVRFLFGRAALEAHRSGLLGSGKDCGSGSSSSSRAESLNRWQLVRDKHPLDSKRMALATLHLPSTWQLMDNSVPATLQGSLGETHHRPHSVDDAGRAQTQETGYTLLGVGYDPAFVLPCAVFMLRQAGDDVGQRAQVMVSWGVLSLALRGLALEDDNLR